MVEATSAVVRVVGGELLVGGDTTLLLRRARGVGGSLGELLGALIGEVPRHSALVAVVGGLVLGGDGNSVAPSPWSSVGVIVGGARWGAVEVAVVVVVVAAWPRVSSTTVLITRT